MSSSCGSSGNSSQVGVNNVKHVDDLFSFCVIKTEASRVSNVHLGPIYVYVRVNTTDGPIGGRITKSDDFQNLFLTF